MYKCLLFLSLVLLNLAGYATEFYSQQSGSPNTLSTWNSQRNGSGTAPSNFSTNGDVFIIQNGHQLTTSAAWTLTGSATVLRIESGGILQADHGVTLNGVFEILDNGKYIHNNQADNGNNGFGDNVRGIFSGTNTFSPNSTVEIRNWSNNTTWLPMGFDWGNLVINYTRNIGGQWNQEGTVEFIKGDLIIEATGPASNSFALVNESSMQLDVDGDLQVKGGKFIVKTGGLTDSEPALMLVNGNLAISGGVFDLGSTDFLPNNEVHVQGDVRISAPGTITTASPYSMLVLNGTSAQDLQVGGLFDASLKVMPDAVVNMSAHFSMGEGMYFIISGTFNSGTFDLELPNVELFVAGGTLNSSGVIFRKSGRTAVCTGNGLFAGPAFFCGTNGSKGTVNLDGAFMMLNQSVLSMLSIGQLNSPGEWHMTNNAVVSFTDEDLGSAGSVELVSGSELSLDEYSVIEGNATYYGRGGHLVIGSSDGITASLESGNITVTVNRFYDEENINTFEYRSTLGQFTGNGLPQVITGDLIINNSSVDGVGLSRATSIAPGGSIQLVNGKITSVGNILFTIEEGASVSGGSRNSFIDGPLRKIGVSNFTFPIGRADNYTPVQLNEVSGGATTDSFRVEYFPGSPQSQFGNNLREPLHHISNVEYWTINKESGNATKSVRLSFNERSGVSDFSSLTLANFIEGQWQEVNKTGTTGTSSSGTISFNTAFFGNFTLASTNTQNPLPVNILSFNALREGTIVKLDWEISADDTPASFEVLYSADNRNFSSIGVVEPQKGVTRYAFSHPNLQAGANYYRLRALDVDGSARWSKVLVVYYKSTSGILAALNPSVSNTTTNLSLTAAVSGRYKIAISNTAGQLMHTRDLQVREGLNTLPLDISELPAGVYTLSVYFNDQRVSAVRFVRSR